MSNIQKMLDNYKKQLFDLLVSSRLCELDTIEEKKRIIEKLTPPIEKIKLYRYCKLDTNGYVLSSLRHGYITMTTPLLFNDPYDSLLFVDRERVRGAQKTCPPKKLLEYIIAKKRGETVEKNSEIEELDTYEQFLNSDISALKKLSLCSWEELEQNTSELIKVTTKTLQNSFRVCCFSECCTSPLMWSHYADLGRGICIEYDMPLGCIDMKQIGCNQSLDLFCSPVLYSDSRYDATKLVEEEVNHLLNCCIKGYDHNKNYDLLRNFKIALFKSSDWSYEREWRLFMNVTSNPCPDRVYINMPVVESIILGHNICDAQIELVQDVVQYVYNKTGKEIVLKRAMPNIENKDYLMRIENIK